MKRAILFFTALLSFKGFAEEKGPKVEFGFFIDSYYAFDANQPPNRERSFTTLPARHNEFTINLAHIDAKVTGENIRGRLALQTGTSVSANYSSEVRDPAKNGAQLADLMQLIQEATAGYRIADGLWIDGGIYLSHIGLESFLSRDNWTYTRSLVADFSPYYQAGVRLTYDINPRWSLQLHVMNGWQNTLETNGDKALGTQIKFRPNERLSITHNSFSGREAELRIFQDLIVKYQMSDAWESALSVDFGLQKRPAGGFAHWYGATFQNRFRLLDRTHLAFRLEFYSDPEGIIAATGTPNGFQVYGASVNVDQKLTPQLLWRNEVRWLQSEDAIFPSDNGLKSDTLCGVTSLALSL